MVNETTLNRSLKIFLLVLLVLTALYYGKPFLVPVVIAALLSMLLLPLAEKLEKKGWSKGLSILSSVLILLVFVALIITVLSWQISEMAKDAPRIEKNFTDRINQVKQKITSVFGMPPEKQEQAVQQQQQSGGSKISTMVTGALSSAMGFIAHFILILVYIFLFLYYRTHLKKFLLKIVSKEDQPNTKQIVEDCRQVAQKYLSGLAMMIVGLWIMYSIGFNLVGVKNAFFFAFLCGLLEIVPFIGNLVGVMLTLAMTMAQGGNSSMIIGILVTYGIVQFVQTYLLEPLVVGKGVNLNPLSTIAGLVAGEILWGISGLVLAIPVLAIIKIICDHIEVLKPYGQLLGTEGKQEGGSLQQKLKKWLGGKK